MAPTPKPPGTPISTGSVLPSADNSKECVFRQVQSLVRAGVRVEEMTDLQGWAPTQNPAKTSER
jgi:hypothetical protein